MNIRKPNLRLCQALSFRMSLMLYLFIWLLPLCGSLESQYRKLDMLSVCHGDKAVVSLGHKALILHLNISEPPVGDFSCHMELEVSKGFGFHVFIEEMYFHGSESSGGPGCEEDFLQFARDILFFTTHSSPKYCGIRSRLNYTHYPFISSTLRRPYSKLARMYVENKDSEMDVWVKFSSLRAPRNLTLVVTPFKKKCRRTDPYYRMCAHSTHCIHKSYFCDDYVNCAWPGGDSASDEVFCKKGNYIGGSKDPYSSLAGDFSDHHNIPLIIVVIILVLLLIFCLAFGLQVFYRRLRKSDEVASSAASEEDHRRGETTELYEEGASREPLRSMPSAPPSYEDVISNQALMRPTDDDHCVAFNDPPPMYTPS